MKIFVILTSYREEKTISKAVEQIILPNKDLWDYLYLVVVSPDEETLNKAKETCKFFEYRNYSLLQDEARGKAEALNKAFEHINFNHSPQFGEDVLVFTDGDMYIEDSALKELLKPFQSPPVECLAGISGRVVSLDDRSSQFGYYSHLFCEAAHIKRLSCWNKLLKCYKKLGYQSLTNYDSISFSGCKDNKKSLANKYFVPMSGYLFAIKFVDGVFPIPTNLKAEDAYISKKLAVMGYIIGYAPNSLAFVKFPKNLDDWIKQKTRSLGGNVQISKFFKHGYNIKRQNTSGGSIINAFRLGFKGLFANSARSVFQDLSMFFFPLVFAKTPKEFIWSLALYPLRLFLWLKIYYNHLLNRYKEGSWERIESSK